MAPRSDSAHPKGKGDRQRVLDAGEKALFAHISPDLLDRVKIVRTRFLPPAADGMTIGRVVFLRPDHFHGKGTLLAHELVHVRQFAEMGMSRFFRQYVLEYLGGLLKFRSHRAAYLAISLEREAREEAARWAETPDHSSQ